MIKGHACLDRSDGAIICAVAHADIDAAAGDGNRRAQRLRFLRFSRNIVPTLLVVNKMDLDGADRAGCLAQLRERLHDGCVDFTQEREGETALLEAGYGVLRDGRLVGYLDGEGARGLELLTGRTAADMLEIELPSGRTVVRLTGAAVQWSPEFQGNDLKRLHLTCRVTAALAEGRRQLEEQEQEQLRRALEAREEERLRRVLDQLRSWGADCAGVGSQVGRADPARWEKLRDRWTRLFSTVPVEISVEVSLGAR